jgi:phosphatidylinositol phospholipase C delta
MSTTQTHQSQFRPTQVLTSFQSHPAGCGPTSALSSSSVASNSQHGSPIMSPDTAVLTSTSSIQASPDPLRGVDEEQYLPPFQLPESIISRRDSSTSLSQSFKSSPIAIPEAPASAANITPTGSKTSLIRRLSSRASRITNRRRQSSAQPTARDTSVGPCLLRRRSDSNTTAPPEFPPLPTDFESDVDERDDVGSLRSMVLNDVAVKGSSANSTTGSVADGSNTMAGPVVPVELRRGTWVRKVSRKNGRGNRVCLVYDADSSKLTWDKKRPNKCVHLDDVLAVRSGSDVLQYGLVSGTSSVFTIIYTASRKSDSKLIHLIADNAEICSIWTSFLNDMLKHRQTLMTSLMAFKTEAISHYWHTEMARREDDQEELDIDGVKRMCQNLHIYSSQSTLERNFYHADARKRERLNLAEFLDFVRRMTQRPDIQRIYRSIASQPELGITLDEFLQFVREVQREDVDSNLAAWEKAFYSIIRQSRAGNKLQGDLPETPVMFEAAFVGYMTAKHNGPTIEEPQEYTLDRPMNEYFISSSHNTYLLGRQVAGQSSVEGYIAALVQGCRCVEVDCWDGPDNQPQVVHGRTLTTAIGFREVMTTINKYAFVKSLYPLWISLEVHCNAAQQAVMAETIKEIFGARLVTEPLDPTSDKLPSPSQLMERVLIKVKKPRMKTETAGSEPVGRRRGNSLTSMYSRPSLGDTSIFTPSQSLPQSPLLGATNTPRRLVGRNRVNTINEGEVSDLLSISTSDSDCSDDNDPVRRSSNKTVQVLGQLGVYCAGVKFSGFDTPDAKRFNHIFSFMESSFAKHSRSKEDKMSLDIHNMRYLMRVYPDVLRLSSSNFDPLIYWRRGVQMAALNWQTCDLGMQVNRAMFEGGTDSSGYVLKPEALRDIRVLPYNTDIAEGKKVRSVVSFSIDVLSAQQLMRPANLSANKSMNPYVEVQILGGRNPGKKDEDAELADDLDSLYKGQTEVVRENGFNPMFNDGHFKFKVITKHPELLFVKWTVKLSPNGENYNHKDQTGVASWVAKLCNLKQGYRSIPLANDEGIPYLFSSLFCKIQMDPIEEKAFPSAARRVPESGKLKSFGDKVFGRINTSPRGTLERTSVEKTSFDSFP